MFRSGKGCVEREEEMESFVPIRFRTFVQLAPSEMTADFVGVIRNKLGKTLEGMCTRFGYIKPGSIEIIKRSAGQFVKQHFNGNVKFDMICRAEVCNPAHGLVVKAIVKVKNEMGLLAESSIDINGTSQPVLDIIVPLRAAGITSEIPLDDVEVGDEIYVAVMSKRYQLNDKKISIIGRAVRKPEELTPQQEEEEYEEVVAGNDNEDEEASLPEENEEEEEEEGEESDDDAPPKVIKVPVAAEEADVMADVDEFEGDDEFFDEDDDGLENDDYEY